MIRRLAGFSLALAIGATVLHAQDTIDPKTGKKRGPMEVLRDRDRPGKPPSTSPAPRPNPNPTHDVYRIHDRDREERERIARHEERERRERFERERRERFERERRERERVERERHERFERAHANPPGWSKGKKTGWGDCDLPPGQAKKYGCHSHDRSHRHKHRG